MPIPERSAQQLFVDPQFTEKYDEWQGVDNQTALLQNQLYDDMFEARKSPHESEDEVENRISYILEMLSDLSLEECKKSFRYDLLLQSEQQLLASVKESEEVGTQKRADLLDYVRSQGANQFAVYALDRYLFLHSENVETQRIVTATEENLQSIDQLVRRHAGDNVLFIGSYSIRASQLSDGGITMFGTDVLLPTNRATITTYDSRLSVVDDFMIPAYAFEKPAFSAGEGYDALQASNISMLGSTLFFGEIPQGPLHFDFVMPESKHKQDNIDYLISNFELIRKVVDAASKE